MKAFHYLIAFFGIALWVCMCSNEKPPDGHPIDKNINLDEYIGLTFKKAFGHLNYVESKPDLINDSRDNWRYLIVAPNEGKFVNGVVKFNKTTYNVSELISYLAHESDLNACIKEKFYVVSALNLTRLNESIANAQGFSASDALKSCTLNSMNLESVTLGEVVKYINERMSAKGKKLLITIDGRVGNRKICIMFKKISAFDLLVVLANSNDLEIKEIDGMNLALGKKKK